MMWEGNDEPLYEELILGERVVFFWRQQAKRHFIRAEWNPLGSRGNPWDLVIAEGEADQRHLAIGEASEKIRQMIEDAQQKRQVSAAR